MQAYLNGQPITLDHLLGVGGEAEIYRLGKKAVKIYKTARHPDFAGAPEEQRQATERIAEHQHKLRDFPTGLPARVIAPTDLITDGHTRIVGYAMPLLAGTEPLRRYSDKTFRLQGIGPEVVRAIFTDLHPTVQQLHSHKVVISDFNDLNVLIKNNEAYIIDADSFGFGQYLSRLFTVRFVDPLLCDPKADRLNLVKPHNFNSDWYAFAIMLMQSLLFVDPYGGVYIPNGKNKRIAHDARPLKRITVFHPEVRYPKPATPYQNLPDDLLHYFEQTFVKDERGEFPLSLLTNWNWAKCTVCGTEHGRATCPNCGRTGQIVKQKVVARGKVIATLVFKTNGIIMQSAIQDGRPLWLYHDDHAFRREDNSVLISGEPDPKLRLRLQGDKTIVGKNGQAIIFHNGKIIDRVAVDDYAEVPMFDTNHGHYYYLTNGQLYRNGDIGREYMGDTLTNQTIFWVGEKFGLGFYRAGALQIGFVFNSAQRGINDRVTFAPIRGHLIDATTTFSGNKAYFFTSSQESGRTVNRCQLVNSAGEIEASAEALAGDGSWLGIIRGHVALANCLLSPTDNGVVKVETQNCQLTVTKEFPDTEPFVDTQSKLLAGNDGLYVVGRHEIWRLQIK